MSKGGICAAIEGGCTTVGALKTKTKAGTTCGGCTPLVTQILNAELKKRGVTVNTSMCEHFPYTRQQLFHLVRIGELKTFEDTSPNTAAAWAAISASRRWRRSWPRAGTSSY